MKSSGEIVPNPVALLRSIRARFGGSKEQLSNRNEDYTMNKDQISRRSLLLKGGGTTWAGLTALQLAGPASVFGNADEEVIPWLDQAPPPPFPPSAVGNQVVWENLDSWFTPA